MLFFLFRVKYSEWDNLNVLSTDNVWKSLDVIEVVPFYLNFWTLLVGVAIRDLIKTRKVPLTSDNVRRSALRSELHRVDGVAADNQTRESAAVAVEILVHAFDPPH